MRVSEIETAISELPRRKWLGFANGLLNSDNDARDAQIEADAAAGKLDALAAEALTEYPAGKASEFETLCLAPMLAVFLRDATGSEPEFKKGNYS